jgi:dTDP-4-amino-4,6-dideoxygalactose transaminase
MIRQADLKKQYELIKKEIDTVVMSVLKSGQYVKGNYLKKFENKFAKYCHANFAVGVNSGTDALFLSLVAHGIKEGDEVITTPFTFVATAEAIIRTGAKPIFVDIEKDTYTIDIKKIHDKITKKTRAIIPVHIYGQQMNKIRKLYQRLNGDNNYSKIVLIEDSCQSVGAKYNNIKFWGTACFSFFPSKNLGCYGDGGIVVTNSLILGDQLISLREHGFYKKYYFENIGINSRLDEIQAAILLVKLQYIDIWNGWRKELAERYNKELMNYVQCPQVSKCNTHVYHQYVIQSDRRDKLKDYLLKNKIDARVVYPQPLHLQKCFKYLGYKKGDFPVAEKTSKRILSLPLYPEMSEKQQDLIINKIKKFYGR